MNNMTEIWNRRLMGTERDVSVQAIPSIRYAILSVPRSGSTLVARGLEATSELGVPLEYFNPNAIEA
jgi:LPS sulfotransferase NodH